MSGVRAVLRRMCGSCHEPDPDRRHEDSEEICGKTGKEQGAGSLQRVVAAAKRLLEVVYKNEGLANKELAKFESQIQNLADKWDR